MICPCRQMVRGLQVDEIRMFQACSLRLPRLVKVAPPAHSFRSYASTLRPVSPPRLSTAPLIRLRQPALTAPYRQGAHDTRELLTHHPQLRSVFNPDTDSCALAPTSLAPRLVRQLPYASDRPSYPGSLHIGRVLQRYMATSRQRGIRSWRASRSLAMAAAWWRPGHARI